jgi:hypothetical protein
MTYKDQVNAGTAVVWFTVAVVLGLTNVGSDWVRGACVGLGAGHLVSALPTVFEGWA